MNNIFKSNSKKLFFVIMALVLMLSVMANHILVNAEEEVWTDISLTDENLYYYIDTHIPSSGPLKREKYLESYKKAAEFFKNYFIEKDIIFGCYSWILSPDNKKILPPGSNILPFMSDYQIVFVENDLNNTTFWRIFATRQVPENLEDLPTDTSIRKAFANWLKSGKELKVAFGILKFDNLK